MKFSYHLIKKLGTRISTKEKLIEVLNFHAFEAVDLPGDGIEISVPANRYSDGSSHYGIAVVASAAMGKKAPNLKFLNLKAKKKSADFGVTVVNKKLCPRYSAFYSEVKNIGQSPDWLQEILKTCGLRPINAAVDIMNYVMLETGQPLHVFDFEKIEGHQLTVRLAKKDEKIRSIDDVDYPLGLNDLVIADDKGPVAIAGIKGGKRAEIDPKSKRIIVEAANFDAAGIYKTSRSLNLITDASSRFNHGLSPVLVERAVKRAAELLKAICGAKIGDWIDAIYKKPVRHLVKFDNENFNRLTGLKLKEKEALEYLKRLGFVIKGKIVEAPAERTDVAILADLAEEIINIYGYEKLPAAVPRVYLVPSGDEDRIVLKDKIRRLLIGFGLSEAYNYSFVSRKDLISVGDVNVKWWGAVALKNPVSDEFAYLRPSLSLGLFKNVKDNLRFFDEVRVFELGRVFAERERGFSEDPILGMAIGFKKGNPVLELKGLVDELLKRVGLVDYFFRDLDTDLKFLDVEHSLRIESGNHQVIGYLGLVNHKISSNTAIAELYLDKLLNLIVEEKEYLPLSKFPSVMRDLSLLVPESTRVGEIMETIELGAPRYVDDVDLVDFYQDERLGADRKSLTFRLVFQANDRTLTDEEVGQEMEEIIAALQQKFDVEVR